MPGIHSVNIVSNPDPKTGLYRDALLIRATIKRLFPKSKIRLAHFREYQAPPADIQFFLEHVTPELIPSSSRNILIPNQEWFQRSWRAELHRFQEIWTKTHQATNIFRTILAAEKARNPHLVYPSVHFIGWTTHESPTEKPLTPAELPPHAPLRCLHLAGQSQLKGTALVVETWNKQGEHLPPLTLVSRQLPPGTPPISDPTQIHHVSEQIPDAALREIFRTHQIHLCPSAAEGFGLHAEEAAAAGRIVVTLDAPPLNERFSAEDTQVLQCRKKPMRKTLGSAYTANPTALFTRLNTILATEGAATAPDLPALSRRIAASAAQRRSEFQGRFTNAISGMTPPPTPTEVAAFPTRVSVVTLTADRRNLFPIATHSFRNQEFPKTAPRPEIEWVIVENGHTEQAAQMTRDIPNVKIIRTPPNTIGALRNIGVAAATAPVILFMDDDDQYPPTSFATRLKALQKTRACATTTLGSFHIRRMISHISHPPPDLSLEARISEASLGFHKSLWEEKGFDDEVRESEGEEFFKHRTHEITLVPFIQNIHSLLHEGNENARRGLQIKDLEPNGNHFPWSDDLFKFITQLPPLERPGTLPQPTPPTSPLSQLPGVQGGAKQGGRPDMSGTKGDEGP